MKKLLLSLLFSLIFLSPAPQVYANITPHFTLGGQGALSPGSTTKVQMKNEKVTFNIGKSTITTVRGYDTSSLPIKVTAQFSMYNTSDTSESIGVKFPPCDYYSINSRPGEGPHCDGVYSNFAVSVNNQKITNVNLAYFMEPDYQPPSCPQSQSGKKFYNWHQSFPAKKITSVTVTYDIDINIYDGPGYYLDYVLSTGGNWFGNIENGEIIFSFPDPVRDEYYKLTSGNINNLSPKLTKSIADNTLSVKYLDIKPTVNENLHLFIFDPQERDVIDSLKEKAKNDNTVSAYNTLGTEYTKLSGRTINPSYYVNNVNADYSKQALIYFDKAIDLANNFNDLQQITNSIFLIENGGDQQEVDFVNSSYEDFRAGSNWIEGMAAYKDIAINTFLKLANKRLSMVSNDAFGLNLKDVVKKITSMPSQSYGVNKPLENSITSCPSISTNPNPTIGTYCLSKNCPSQQPPAVVAAEPSPAKITVQTPTKTTIKILGLNIDRNIFSASTIIIILTGLWFFMRNQLTKKQKDSKQPSAEDTYPPNESKTFIVNKIHDLDTSKYIL